MNAPHYLLLAAGGSGTRAGGDIPKQFVDLGGRPVFMHAVEAFIAADPKLEFVCVVTHRSFVEEVRQELSRRLAATNVEFDVVEGGASRTESVRNGLKALPLADGALVAIHDAARPFVTRQMIMEGWGTVVSPERGGVPVLPVTDSLRERTGNATTAIDRSRFLAVQTPQVFDFAMLSRAYAATGEGTFTDDASVAEAFGMEIVTYPGDPANIKITNPMDFAIAEAILSHRGTKC